MNVSPRITLGTRLAGAMAGITLLCAPLVTWASIDYTDSQRDTIVEMIEQLAERHYAKLTYNDEFSSQHLFHCG